MNRNYLKKLALILGVFSSQSLFAADRPVIEIVVKDGYFTPSEVHAPANVKFELLVKNEGSSAEESESSELNREKVIPPKQSGKIKLGPLSPNTYSFIGEYHADTAKGTLVVK